MRRKSKLIIGGVLAVAAAIGLGVAIYFLMQPTVLDTNTLDPPNPTEPLPPSDSLLGVYWDAAVVTNGLHCAIIGRNILMKGGNAVDAAIASLFCEGIACPQSMGLGGGFLMTIYIKETNESITLNAREVAPFAATEDMFEGNSNMSRFGGLAVAVPGELKGYYDAWERYGSKENVTWADLVQPTIDLCIEGVVVTPYLANVLKYKERQIVETPSLAAILVDPDTGGVWLEGQRIKRLQLAESLKVIQLEGSDALYSANGSLIDDFVADIQEMGGIITVDDMVNYTTRWEDPISADLGDGMSMYTVPPPGSGVLVAFILNILDGFLPDTLSEATTYHRIIESFKYGFGRRTELGDPWFDTTGMHDLIANLSSPEYAENIRSLIKDDETFQDPEHYGAVLSQPPEDHGTAHISVLAPNGDAVSVTSTVNLYFGAMIRSNKTGIILNDEMDDFSSPNITNGFDIPPSPANVIVPGKRPLSSMCPAIFVDKHGDVQLIVGAAGGTKITTTTVLIALHNLWQKKNVKEAVDARRFHHQLFPMHFQYEFGMVHRLVDELTKIGHVMSRYSGESSATAIARSGNMIHANADFRRSGITAGF